MRSLRTGATADLGFLGNDIRGPPEEIGKVRESDKMGYAVEERSKSENRYCEPKK